MKYDVIYFSYSSLCKYVSHTDIIIYYIHYLSCLHNSSMDKAMLHL